MVASSLYQQSNNLNSSFRARSFSVKQQINPTAAQILNCFSGPSSLVLVKTCLFDCVQGRVVHKGPLVPTAADSFILKAVVTGEREKFLCLEISFDSW